MFEPERWNRRTEFDPDNAPNDAPDQSGKCPAHVTFDEAGSGDAGAQQSNSETVVDALFDAAGCKLRSASGNSFDALKAHAEVGQALVELKEHLAHGNFGQEVESRLGIKRQWRARVMTVGREWPDILMAIEWGMANNRLTRSEYSVDGTLALLKAWRREVVDGDDSASAGSGAKNFSNDSFAPSGTIKNKSEYLKFFALVVLFELLKERTHRVPEIRDRAADRSIERG